MKLKRIHFSCKTKCQFNCIFCVYDGVTEYFPMEEFKRYANIFHDFGVREFELTPVTGESLLDPNLTEKVEYLSGLGVEKILFFSNGHGNLYEYYRDFLSQYPEVEINLSVYGGDREEYIKRTGVDGYDNVLTNIYRFLSDKDLESKNFIIHKRYSGVDSSKLKMAYDISKVRGIQIWDCSHDTDWKEMTSSCCHLYTTEKGVCRFALEDNAVLSNGDITLCGWFDVNKKMIMGNINEQTLDEIYSDNGVLGKIITGQKNGVYRDLCCVCTMKNVKRN